MKSVAGILFLFVLLASCSKENSDSFFPYPNNPVNDTAWSLVVPSNSASQRMMESLMAPPMVDSFTSTTGGVLQFPDHLQIAFPPSSLQVTPGTIYNGKVKVNIVSLRRKGDMVRYLRPTTSHGKLLETGGAFFIQATGNGQNLSLIPGHFVGIKYRTTGTPNPLMAIFYGEEPNSNTGFTWVPANDSSTVRPFTQQDSTGISRGYEAFSQRLRWVNIDYFYDTTQPRTRLDVVLPPNYTNTNTHVFAVFNNENIVVQLNAAFATRTFYALNIPIGKQVKIISLSKVGDALHMGIKDIITTVNQPINMQPELRTKAQIEQLLQSL